jgi:peptide/nickel transport system permease protein
VWRYIVARIAAVIPMTVLVTMAVFWLLHGLLGDPTLLILGRDADPQTAARLRHELGLDLPLDAQYLAWLSGAARGDLGRSLRTRQPVAQAIRERLGPTAELTLASMALAAAAALVLGTVAGTWYGSAADFGVSSLCVIGVTLPNFLLGISLILVFALTLRWVPSGGFVPLFPNPSANLQHMALPIVTLSVAYVGILSLVLKSSLRATLGALYVQTARAKGLVERRVLVRHALRNSLIPVLSVLGIEFGRLFGGAVVTETVFALPGVGRLLVDAILGRDFPVVQAVVVLMTFGVLFVNLAVDLSYAWLDPRVSYG